MIKEGNVGSHDISGVDSRTSWELYLSIEVYSMSNHQDLLRHCNVI
jgi:hypothetical protein